MAEFCVPFPHVLSPPQNFALPIFIIKCKGLISLIFPKIWLFECPPLGGTMVFIRYKPSGHIGGWQFLTSRLVECGSSSALDSFRASRFRPFAASETWFFFAILGFPPSLKSLARAIGSSKHCEQGKKADFGWKYSCVISFESRVSKNTDRKAFKNTHSSP